MYGKIYSCLINKSELHQFTYISQDYFVLDTVSCHISSFEQEMRLKVSPSLVHRINNIFTAIKGFARTWPNYDDTTQQQISEAVISEILKAKSFLAQTAEPSLTPASLLWRHQSFSENAPDYIWDDQAKLYDLVMRFLDKKSEF